MEHSFNQRTITNIVRVTIIDNDGRSATVYFNEGIQIIGESLNEPVTENIVLQGKPPQIIQITQIDREFDLWQDDNESIWTRNSFDHWIKLTIEEYVMPIDATGFGGYERIHPNFAMYKMGQELYAKQIWDGDSIQSQIPDYTSDQRDEFESDSTVQLVLDEKERASAILSAMYPGLRHNFEN